MISRECHELRGIETFVELRQVVRYRPGRADETYLVFFQRAQICVAENEPVIRFRRPEHAVERVVGETLGQAFFVAARADFIEVGIERGTK